MAHIEHLIIEADDPTMAESFYAAIDLGDRVRVRQADAPTSGFRGWSLSFVVAQPSTVDAFIASALEAGATTLKAAAKSMWGYGGAVAAPDGTLVTFASSSKKDTGPATRDIDALIAQLGVADVGASKQFYADRGFAVDKSYGRKYVEFDSGPTVKLTLNSPKTIAKLGELSPEGSGSHRVAFVTDAGAFADPDGYVWEAA